MFASIALMAVAAVTSAPATGLVPVVVVPGLGTAVGAVSEVLR